MTRRDALRACCGGAAALATARAQTSARPNVVFILADDLGQRDVGCYGSTFHQTPHLDALARRGMRFTQAYAACPVCSPTRASILTGQYPARLHLTDWIAGHRRPWAKLRVPDWTQYLDHAAVTLPELLKPLGYHSASIGKWHLGGAGYEPTAQGFDLNVAGTDKGSPASYFSPYRNPLLPDGPVGEYLTDRLTTEAIAYLTAQRDRPFCLYLPHYAVHTPIQPKPEVAARYAAKAGGQPAQSKPGYAALVESVDDSVGRLLAALDELRLTDRTLVIFMSDNGGLAGQTSNAPLRSGKGSLYEGGIREPLLVAWPGQVAPGSTCDEPVTSVDFLPTLLDACGVPAAGRPLLDGVSLLPLLRQTGRPDREAIYWHYPHYHPAGESMGGALRAGEWKLLEWFETGAVELYHLPSDPGEQRDLAAAEPARAKALQQRLAAWRSAVGAQLPTPNPDYDPARAKQPPNPRRPATAPAG